VVAGSGHRPTETDLIAFCHERLGGFETPKRVLFTDALPETVGGKVLKYKLREQYANACR
jgi:acyl-CoA synthetase (AMP-forming)/AMP-acid ligase II